MNGTGIVLALGELMADPSPSDGGEFNSVSVSPGLPGFLAMFVLAVAVVLLAIDMNRRTRRVQARARVHERMAAEDREREVAAQGSDDESTSADEDAQDAEGETTPQPLLPGPPSAPGDGGQRPRTVGQVRGGRRPMPGPDGVVPGQGGPKKPRGRASMPSWDEIVFGARSDDDPA